MPIDEHAAATVEPEARRRGRLNLLDLTHARSPAIEKCCLCNVCKRVKLTINMHYIFALYVEDKIARTSSLTACTAGCRDSNRATRPHLKGDASAGESNVDKLCSDESACGTSGGVPIFPFNLSMLPQKPREICSQTDRNQQG